MSARPLPAPAARSDRSAARALKRALEVLLAGFALVLLRPLIALIALAIRTDSPGPILLRQERVGREGRRFVMWALPRDGVPPGMTGLWQVSGRTTIGFEDMLRLDCRYVATWSLRSDEVEFKRDPRSAAAKLLDINPRAWGWQSLCGRAGVEFPYLLWRMACGERLPEVRAAPGVRWVRVATDVAAATGEIRAGRLSARSYLRSLRGPLESAVFAADDPLPPLAAPLDAVRIATRRVLDGQPV
jgi:sugar transferase